MPYQVADRVGGVHESGACASSYRFALDGLTSFSTLPLRVWSLLGLAISILAIIYATVIFIRTIVFGADVPGFPSIIISVMLLAGVQLISLGVIGEYLGRVYEEVKFRPLFLVCRQGWSRCQRRACGGVRSAAMMTRTSFSVPTISR